MTTFTFDPINHTYFLDGKLIYGVTDILAIAGLRSTYRGHSAAQQRGQYVHQCCELLDLHDLDWSSVLPDYLGYVKAYERFTHEANFKPVLIEKPSYHPILRVAGTPDRFGALGDDPAQVDIKTGQPADWHPYQTGAYNLIEGEPWLTARRFNVYLAADGTYALVEHTDAQDFEVFLAAVTIAQVKYKRIHAAPDLDAKA